VPPLMRSRHGPGAAGHTGHSMHTQGCVATRPLARQRQSAVGLHLRNPSLMDHYSFNRPPRDGRLSRPCCQTDSGRFTHKEFTRPAISLAQDRESTPAEPAVLTTMPRHHQLTLLLILMLQFRMCNILKCTQNSLKSSQFCTCFMLTASIKQVQS